MARMLRKELAPNPESSSSKEDKGIPDFYHFGQPHLSHRDNLLSKVLLNDYKNYGICLARLEQLDEIILVYACEYKWEILYFQQFSELKNINILYLLNSIFKTRFYGLTVLNIFNILAKKSPYAFRGHYTVGIIMCYY